MNRVPSAVSDKEMLVRNMERIRKQHERGASGQAIVEARTRLVDGLIQGLFENLRYGGELGPCALIAVGGYGRGELNPHSDIDLLFLHNSVDPEGLIRRVEPILYALWDTGLDLGYSVRNADESIRIARTDSTVRTAMVDMRYLDGDRDFFRSFKERMFAEIYRKDVPVFVEEKLRERSVRQEKYGRSVYLLEPNIKEGEGGLRDLHTAHWIARVAYGVESLWDLPGQGLLSSPVAESLRGKRDFLWRLRNDLHFISGRKNDQMTFEYQEKIARDLGYRNSRDSLAVERMMQDYYRAASEIKQFTLEFADRVLGHRPPEGARRQIIDGCEVSGGMVSVPEEAIVASPPIMMKAFLVAQAAGAELSGDLKGHIRTHLPLVTEEFQRDPQVLTMFQDIIWSGRACEILQRMNELRFLGALIPEFDRLVYRAQHDIYHVYTVDAHSLFALGEMEKLRRGDLESSFPLLTQTAKQVEDMDNLLLGGLFHDIGKGLGRGHVEKGMRIVPDILTRLGYGRKTIDTVVFLIKNHLLMSHIAFRRDLHEEKTIHDLAHAMKTQNNLRMLYILTFADIRAVGPESWSNWKGALLQELYLKAVEELEEGGLRGPRHARREAAIESARREARALLSQEMAPEQVEDYLADFHHRYFVSYTPREIAGHARLFAELTPGVPLVIRKTDVPDKGYSEITLCTVDSPGLLSNVAGVLAANNINILGVRINVRKDGTVLDTYHVSDYEKHAVTDESRWTQTVDNLTGVLTGAMSVDALVAKSRRPSIVREKIARRIPTKITVDNRSSDLCTVLDVYTHDRPGLLYTMTSTLYRLGLYIAISKISTKVDQVADVFYVQDLNGRKIMDKSALDRIVRELKKAIDDV